MLKKKIGNIQDLNKNNQFSRWIDDHDILIYKNGNKIEAISNICPHFGGPIGYHEIKVVNNKPVFTEKDLDEKTNKLTEIAVSKTK